MKNRTAIPIVILILAVVVIAPNKPAMAFGHDLSHPLIRRSYITQGYYSGHKAYDYRARHTKVVAPKDGVIFSSYWERDDEWEWPCDGTIKARGNWIILNHQTGGLKSYYYHLSNTGNTPGYGVNFARGQYMALSDDTGCSYGEHLHFAVRVNGAPVDPYLGNSHWVGGEPIPMGYVDQTGSVHGPHLLTIPEIRDKWLALGGKPGSPLDSYYPVGSGMCRQDFERGYIVAFSAYCPFVRLENQNEEQEKATSASYHSYQKTFLPDIRAHRLATGGWNSTITIRNDGPGAADVTFTVYRSDGKVKDARTYRGLPNYATWTISARDVVYDLLLNDWTNDFRGTAVVTASKDVSVVVAQGRTHPEAWAAYNGVQQSVSRIHVPILHRNNYGWDSQIFIQNMGSASTVPTIQFKYTPGYPGSSCNYRPPVPVSPGGQVIVDLDSLSCVGPTFVGSAYILADQPMAVTHTQFAGQSMLMESSRDGGVEGGAAGTVFAPLVQNDNYDWYSGIAAQNAAGISQPLYLKYHRYDHGGICHSMSKHIGARRVFVIPNSPQGGNQGGGCTPVLTARIYGSSQNTAGTVNQLLPGSSYATDYPAVANPSLSVSAPLMMKDWQGWGSGISVLNTTGQVTDIIVAYYHANGSPAGQQSARLTSRGAAWVIYPISVGSGFYGSAQITASRPVAVTINHVKSGGDGIMSHIGVH